MRSLRDIMHHNVLNALSTQFFGYSLCHLFGISVHGTISYHYTFFGFVTAQLIVHSHYFCYFFFPYWSVCRTNHLYIESAAFLQCLLHRVAELTYDIRVVTTHLAHIDFGIDILINAASVKCTEASKGIAREENAVCRIECYHSFRPMYHRDKIKVQVMTANFQRIAFGYYFSFATYTVVSVYHIEGLLVSYQNDVGIILLNQ